jgi:Zn-dependent peptidase ImmA (M78 family)/transcriptional regulator with XRE-family HTH domain
MSIGGRIKLARQASALSMRDLAKKVELSAMAISKYERDLDIPSSRVLIRLAKALAVKAEYFFRDSPEKISLVLYRKHARLSKTSMNAIHARIQEWLERYLEIESFSIDEKVQFNFLHRFKVDVIEDVEEAAKKLRNAWSLGLDPLEGLIDCLENRGIKILLLNCDSDFDACTFMNNGSPVIVVQKNVPGDRKRFNIAHELGHLVLDFHDNNLEEKAAYRFAGAFIFPDEAAIQELGNIRSKLGMEELYLLKRKYGISMQAIIYRAKDLGIISEGEFRRMFIEFTSRGYRQQEPGDLLKDTIEIEKPKRMQMMLLRLLSEGIISQSKAEELNHGKTFELGGIEAM